MKLINLRYTVLSLVIAAGLSGCAITNMDIDKNYKLPKDGSKGIVVISTSFTGFEPSEYFYLYLQNEKKEPLGRFQMWAGDDVTGEEIFTYPRKTGGKVPDGKEIGELNVIELAPGEYEFYKYYGSNQSVAATQTFTQTHITYAASNDNFKLRFKVEPNTVTYLGNLKFYFYQGNKTYSFDMKDRSDRDLNVMKTKYPNLEGAMINKSVISLTDKKRSTDK